MKRYFLLMLMMLFISVPSLASDIPSKDTSCQQTTAAKPSPPEYKAYMETLQKHEQEIHEKNMQQMKARDDLISKQENSHERIMKMYQREDEHLEHQEAQLSRFDKILSTWERQQDEYQKYLDSLKSNQLNQSK